MESSLEISGTLAPRSRVAIKPKLPGMIERVLVDIGAGPVCTKTSLPFIEAP